MINPRENLECVWGDPIIRLTKTPHLDKIGFLVGALRKKHEIVSPMLLGKLAQLCAVYGVWNWNHVDKEGSRAKQAHSMSP